MGAVAGADRGLEMLVEAAGGRERFLNRYAVMVVADHSQSADHPGGRRGREPWTVFASTAVAVASAPTAATSRWRPPTGSRWPTSCPASSVSVAEVAERVAADHAAADVVMYVEDGWFVARAGIGQPAISPRTRAHRRPRDNSFTVEGDADLLPESEYPNALERIEGVLNCPNAGDVVVSAALGYEFSDAGGGHHVGGGSHGSLHAADSLVPLITAGFDPRMQLPDAAVHHRPDARSRCATSG